MIRGLVSCIIPTYRRTDTLVRAVKSLLSQTYENLEIIIIDDNEVDDSYSDFIRKYIDGLQDNRVKYLRMPEHKNGAAARNLGINSAQGEYITFLDDDDEFLISKVMKQVAFLDENPVYEAVSCLYEVYHKGQLVRRIAPYSELDLLKNVLNRTVAICMPSVLIRRKNLSTNIRFDESLRRHQDIQFFVEFLSRFRMGVISEWLVKVHSDSTTNKPTAAQIVSIKEDFFRSVSHVIEELPKKDRKSIMAAHSLEIAYVAFREKRYLLGLKHLVKIGPNLSAYGRLFDRAKERRN